MKNLCSACLASILVLASCTSDTVSGPDAGTSADAAAGAGGGGTGGAGGAGGARLDAAADAPAEVDLGGRRGSEEAVGGTGSRATVDHARRMRDSG